MTSGFRGESRPRRQGVRHHIELSAESHQHSQVLDPFPPLSNKQFPAMYSRNPIKNAYRQFMRAKQPYRKF